MILKSSVTIQYEQTEREIQYACELPNINR